LFNLDLELDKSDKIAKYSGNNLANALQHLEGLTLSCAKKVVEHLTKEITTALLSANKVYIRGIGSLYLVYYPAHFGRHPKTGEQIWIEESLRVKFRPSSLLTRVVNERIATIKKFAEIELDLQEDNDNSTPIVTSVVTNTAENI
jgi:nucleoid DNA-binding protein